MYDCACMLNAYMFFMTMFIFGCIHALLSIFFWLRVSMTFRFLTGGCQRNQDDCNKSKKTWPSLDW